MKFFEVCTFIFACHLTAVCCWWFIENDANNSRKRSPVVIVPGTGGNRLYAKLTGKPTTPAWYCKRKTSGYFTLWLSFSSLFPWAIDCWQDNMRLVYHRKNLTVSNAPGVVTKVPGFGLTNTVETLDNHGLLPYMKPLVNFLKLLGYKRNKDIRAAPYDFRYAPNQMPHNYFQKLKQLIEDSYNENGENKVTLISHSYGCPLSLYFLNMMTQKWKDTYLKQWIALSGVFGGTMRQVLLYGSGDTFGISSAVINPLKIRHEQRTATSNLFMLPSSYVWSSKDIVVKTSKRNYNVGQLNDFLKDVGFPEGVPMRKKIGDIYNLVKAPGVPMFCYYGNIPDSTEELLIYPDDGFPDSQPRFIKGHGDGTVNRESLRVCLNIGQLQKQSFRYREFPGVDHNGVLSNNQVLHYIKDHLFS